MARSSLPRKVKSPSPKKKAPPAGGSRSPLVAKDKTKASKPAKEDDASKQKRQSPEKVHERKDKSDKSAPHGKAGHKKRRASPALDSTSKVRHTEAEAEAEGENESTIDIVGVGRVKLTLPAGDLEQRPILRNVVGACEFGTKLDLSDLCRRMRNSEYKSSKKQPPRLKTSWKKPYNATTILYTTGKVLVMGTSSTEDCELVGRLMVRRLRRLGVAANLSKFRVTNMMATASTGFAIKLNDFAIKHHRFCHYEPELFPSCTYKYVKPKMTIQIFPNGSLVFMGAKSENEIHQVFDEMLKALRRPLEVQKG